MKSLSSTKSRNEVAERSTLKVLATQTSGTLNLEGFFTRNDFMQVPL
jgi:hypothetical protein